MSSRRLSPLLPFALSNYAGGLGLARAHQLCDGPLLGDLSDLFRFWAVLGGLVHPPMNQIPRVHCSAFGMQFFPVLLITRASHSTAVGARRH